MNPDSRETPTMVLKMWKKGLLNRSYFLLTLLASITAENVGEFIRCVPADVLKDVRQEVEDSPTTDEEWAQVFIIHSGDPPDEKAEALQWEEDQRRISRYRIGVETLRGYFAAVHGLSLPEQR